MGGRVGKDKEWEEENSKDKEEEMRRGNKTRNN